jgi:hypothetical protein
VVLDKAENNRRKLYDSSKSISFHQINQTSGQMNHTIFFRYFPSCQAPRISRIMKSSALRTPATNPQESLTPASATINSVHQTLISKNKNQKSKSKPDFKN